MKKFFGVAIAVAMAGFVSCGFQTVTDESVSASVVAKEQAQLRSVAMAEVQTCLKVADAVASATASEATVKAELPKHNARLFDHQAVVLPNGSSVVTSVYERDGIDFLWVSEIAPVGIFNRTLLNREYGDVVDGEGFVFEYYYLTAKPDFYQNKLTAVEITAEEYFKILAAYEN